MIKVKPLFCFLPSALSMIITAAFNILCIEIPLQTKKSQLSFSLETLRIRIFCNHTYRNANFPAGKSKMVILNAIEKHFFPLFFFLFFIKV